MPERKERCETCRWWETELFCEQTVGTAEIEWIGYPGADDQSFVRVGECRRHAPVPVTARHIQGNWPMSCRAEFPVTMPRDWCGEWREREDASEDMKSDSPSPLYFAKKWKQSGMFSGHSTGQITDAINRTLRTAEKVKSRAWDDIRVGIREGTKQFSFRESIYKQMRKEGMLRRIEFFS